MFAELVADKVIKKTKNQDTDPVYSDDDELNTPQAAKVIKKSASTLRNWREQGRQHIPYYIHKDTLEVFYKYRDLRLYLERVNRAK